MDPFFSTMIIEGAEAVGSSVRENSVTYAEQEMQMGTSTETEFAVAVHTEREQRKRKFSSRLNNDNVDDGQHKEKIKKRFFDVEEDKEANSSDDTWCRSVLEDQKENIFEKMRELENKVVILRWARKRKVRCLRSTSLPKVKEQLALVQALYQVIDI